MSWIEFWNGAPPIYVNERHKLLHGRQVARDIISVIPSPDAVLLDYGCGEALAADEIARTCGRLLLSDAAETVRIGLKRRFAGDPKVEVLSPTETEALPEASVDLIVINSLMQYLDAPTRTDVLAMAHDKLKPGGKLIVADIVPPDVSPITDALALLRFGFEGGFLFAAIAGLVRTVFSGYGKLRGELGFAIYAEDEFLTILDHAGFDAHRRQPNFGHNQARMTFEASPRSLTSL